MSIKVGDVTAVNGVKITLRIDEDSNKEVLFYDGDKYKGVSIREYISIRRGFRDIVCIVEGEYLDERRVDNDATNPGYVRRVEVRPLGHFDGDRFVHGIKYLPMIKDSAFLLNEERIRKVYTNNADSNFFIGRMLKEDLPLALPWRKLFNSHMGIFGNTGSGKSNTLAKLYTVLFENKSAAIAGRSTFVVIDFNGEYTGRQLVKEESKAIYRLSTQAGSTSKFPLDSTEFWNLDTLAILFQATQNTQRPFLSRLIDGRAKFETNQHSLTNYTKTTIQKAITAAKPKAESLDLIRSLANRIEATNLVDFLKNVSWHGTYTRFYRPSDGVYFNADGSEYQLYLAAIVDALDLTQLDAFDQLVVRAHLQLIRDLTYGYVQFDHIQPLLKRIEASLTSLRKVLEIGYLAPQGPLVTVISLKRCNNEVKKVLPLLLAKHYYNQHKDSVAQPADKTLHLIIDEAHNILSQQSSREHESWKDYRLELFEEIIKEGRKFGVFITIASQRPADISPTIISQLHNFFIHRLINDRDLFLIENTITTLDSLSRSMIPNLAQSCCVVTGASFDLPVLLQVDALTGEMKPDSEDVDLEALWKEIPEAV